MKSRKEMTPPKRSLPSRTKFDREIADYRAFEADYRTRGWFLVKAEWPVVIVVLASDKPESTEGHRWTA